MQVTPSEDPSAPPALKRQRADADAAPSTPPPASPTLKQQAEPPNGMALGVTTLHPQQQWIPMAFKTDERLATPWTRPPTTSTATNPEHVVIMLLLDLSPSMASPSPGDGSVAAAAVVKLLEGFRAYLAATLTPAQLAVTELCVAGFSGSCGWVDQDHCAMQSPRLNPDDGNWVVGCQIEEIEKQVVDADDAAAVDALLAKWVAKTKRIYEPADEADRDSGRGTNIEAALYFAHRAAEEYCNCHGGSMQAFLLTDGEATTGATRPESIRATLDKAIFAPQQSHAVPIQFHALMMGDDTRPQTLTALLGSAGFLGYAKDAESIAAGLDSILKIPFEQGRGSFDMATFVSYEDASSGAELSDVHMTCYSQGQLCGDNYTALYGARMPPARASAQEAVDSALAKPETVVVRVRGLCAPNLLRDVAAAQLRLAPLRPGNLCNEASDVLNALVDVGHEVLLDKRVPIALDHWWSPEFLSQKYIQATPPPPDASPFDPTGRLYPCVFAKDSGSDCLYRWIEIGQSLRQEINRALASSGDRTDAIMSSHRYARIAESAGYASLGAQCRATREATQQAALDEEEDYQTLLDASNTPDDPNTQNQLRSLSSQRYGSAAHHATATMSQTAASLKRPRA